MVLHTKSGRFKSYSRVIYLYYRLVPCVTGIRHRAKSYTSTHSITHKTGHQKNMLYTQSTAQHAGWKYTWKNVLLYTFKGERERKKNTWHFCPHQFDNKKIKWKSRLVVEKRIEFHGVSSFDTNKNGTLHLRYTHTGAVIYRISRALRIYGRYNNHRLFVLCIFFFLNGGSLNITINPI